MMQYKIPQNVRREDTIVGPLTLKQLAILGVGGGITYVIYAVLARTYFIEVWLPAILPTALLTLAFAFLKINGIPFAKWLLLMVEYMKNPKKRTFIMGAADVYSATIFAKETKKDQTMTTSDKETDHKKKMQQIGEITKLVDSYHKPPKQI